MASSAPIGGDLYFASTGRNNGAGPPDGKAFDETENT